MKLIHRYRVAVKWCRGRVGLYRLVYRDPRTPRVARWLLAAAVGYLLSPIDIIPDWIPLLGHVDDVLIVPGLIALALRLVPAEIIADCRAQLRAYEMTGAIGKGQRDRTSGGS